MANKISARPPLKSIRLTFRVTAANVQLVSQERLPVISPPAIGAAPEAGKHGGFWVELRDGNDRVLYHRALNNPLGDSVDVHSPDGTIRREFGPTSESTFEVLVPDYDEARSVALFGEYLDAETFRREQAQKPSASRELARFDISKGGGSSNQEVQHGHQ
jgi:hypothetical protein